VDEYTFNTLQSPNTVREVLTKHWDTWIVEDDLRRIAEAGLNHVRQVSLPALFSAPQYSSFFALRLVLLLLVVLLVLVFGMGRLPFGYWSVPNPGNDPAPYYPGAWPYVLKTIDWARKYGLLVILDIHGAPGSQNGYDNSGQRMDYPGWASDPKNVNRTLDIVAWLAQTFGGEEYVNVVTMIQLMNEVRPVRAPR
jgi:glucan 1,3-beta-glucosidase